MSVVTFSTNCLVELSVHCQQNARPRSNFGTGETENAVKLSKKGKRTNPAKPEKFSCSGVIIDSAHGLVLTHGSLLSELFTKSACSELIERRATVDFVRLAGSRMKVQHTLKVLLQRVNNDGRVSSGNERRDFQVFSAEPVVAWNCPNLKSVINNLLPKSDGWRFEDVPRKDASVAMVTDGEEQHYLNYDEQAIQPVESKSDISFDSQTLLTWFALLKINDWQKLKPRTDSTNIGIIPSCHLQQGQSLVTIATPFASVCPLVFFNSMSKGIVTNVAGEGNALIMTDARCMPGTEGGAVYTVSHSPETRCLTGLIVAPLCWKSNEWIGLTLVAGISEILDCLRHAIGDGPVKSMLPVVYTKKVDQDSSKDSASTSTLYGQGLVQVMKRVVFVQAGNSWGSGVIIDNQGEFVLTCRHVVKGALNSQVQVRFDLPTRYWTSAEVLFSTLPSSAIDLAVLRIKARQNLHLPDLQMSADYSQGNEVCVVGHALFPRDVAMYPSVTYGVLSNLVTVENRPALLQSTCAVHSGASGGPLLCAKTGQLLGIVASNSKDTDSGASFPHVNFSVPIVTVYKALEDFMNSSDVGHLQALNACDGSFQKIWRLQDDILQDSDENLKCRL